MENTIRRICIGADPKNQFVYFLGGEHKLLIDGKQRTVTVKEIHETEDSYLIYVTTNSEVQLWKRLPKNNTTTIEYAID